MGFTARRRSKRIAVAAGLVIAVGLSPLNPGMAGVYHRQPAQAAASSVANPATLDQPVRMVTLITGDTVVVAGEQTIRSFLPAPNRPDQGYVVRTFNGHTSVIPRDVLSLIPRVLDPALFDVTTLLRERGDDRIATTVPVIVQAAPTNASRRAAVQAAQPGRRALSSINAVAVRVDKARAQELGAQLSAGAKRWRSRGEQAVGARALVAAQLPTKVWLDRKVKVAWDANLEQIHAPAAWEKGLTGKGATIAIIDTGVDATHPDLAGKVVASKNFSTASTDEDYVGHGTHVASVAAGSGAANTGQRKGVAFAAQLLNAKVFDDSGSADFSHIIAGVEWAGQQKASVANMSIQSEVSDGSDPLSQAVNAVSKSSGTLFVAAAGNYGAPDTIGAPGAASEALTVGAVDAHDELASFSSYGPRRGGGIKPEITAGGVDIIAARSSLLGPGQPYISMSGTSMAAPHVAGAAALLRAAHPTWTPAQVKSALATTAVGNPRLSVHQQGGGRLDLAAAATQTVMPDVAALDLGRFAYGQPHPPLTRTLTYTNTGTRAVTLALGVRSSEPVTEQVVRPTPSTLTVPAGGSATATVKVVVDAVPQLGVMDGEVVATPTGANAGMDAPDGVAFSLEKEQLHHTLTIKVVNALGVPDAWPSVSLFDVNDMAKGFHQEYLQFNDQGTAVVEVPEGSYQLEALSTTSNPRGEASGSAWMVKPEVKITADTLVVFDARQAKPVTVSVAERPTQVSTLQLVEKRTDAKGQVYSGAQSTSSDLMRLSTDSPDQAVTTGSWGSYAVARQHAPPVSFSAEGLPMLYPYRVGGAQPYVGQANLPVVSAGIGSTDDFAQVDASGALVVVTRSDQLSILEVMRNAAADRAALLVIANDTDVPWSGYSYFDTTPELPAVTVSSSQGAALRAQERVQAKGQAQPSPVYSVVRTTQRQLPGPVRVEVDELAQMAHVQEAVLSPTGREVAVSPGANGAYISQQRAPIVPGFDPMPTNPMVVLPGARWSEYVSPGWWFSQAFWYQGSDSLTATQPARLERAGTTRMQTWLRAPLRTQPLRASYAGFQPGATRTATQMSLAIPSFSDADANSVLAVSYGTPEKVTSRYTLSRNGQVVGVVSAPEARLTVPRTPGSYQLRYEAKAGLEWGSFASTTTWSFPSAAPVGRDSAALPLLNLGLNLPTDGRNRLVGTKARVSVSLPFAALPPVSSIAMAMSTDGGKTWRRVATSPLRGASVEVSLPRLAADTPVSLMVTAQAGRYRIQQSLINAIRTAP